MHPTAGAPPCKGSHLGVSCDRRKLEGCVRDARRTRLKDDIESVEDRRAWKGSCSCEQVRYEYYDSQLVTPQSASQDAAM